ILFFILRWRRSIVVFVVTMAGAIALNVTLKLSFKRTRPTAFFDTPLPSSYSFPSGHALLSLCFYGALAAILVPHLSRAAPRVLVWTAAALLVALIGFSRIYLGVHYPSDVLAGYAAAIVWVALVGAGDQMLRRKSRARERL
ncbi:MAG TPA: phosphatase PAP2 family protein, partial [Pyrinomonadaceae bacterium]|nr:phosphatase PAP2 family protein [Pyrinomonadaceae bacterium]